jgi:hypothetical protein
MEEVNTTQISNEIATSTGKKQRDPVAFLNASISNFGLKVAIMNLGYEAEFQSMPVSKISRRNLSQEGVLTPEQKTKFAEVLTLKEEICKRIRDYKKNFIRKYKSDPNFVALFKINEDPLMAQNQIVKILASVEQETGDQASDEDESVE